MALKGPGGEDDYFRVTRGKVVETPGVGQKWRDGISGARKPDAFFAIGGKSRGIEKELDRWDSKTGRGGKRR